MKVGDLVKIRDSETSAVSIIISRLSFGFSLQWWLVYSPTMGCNYECPENELEVLSEGR